MKNNLIVVALAVAWSVSASAQTIDPYQSKADPMGLPIVAPVMLAGSDAASKDFQTNVLPGVQSWVSANMKETVPFAQAAKYQLDPNLLTLASAQSVRVYYEGEGAGWANSLGFNPAGYGTAGGTSKIVFPSVTSPIDDYTYGAGPLSNAYPLRPGDFVDLGHFAAGTHLDFFAIDNGANGGTTVMTTNAKMNPDGLSHVVAWAKPNSPYVFLSFKDQYGLGDKDFNDLRVVINVGVTTVNKALGVTPEPSVLIMAAALGTLLLVRRRAEAMV